MADNWYEYFYGSPEQQAAESSERARRHKEITSSPDYRALRGLKDNSLLIDGRTYDPREIRLAMVQDTLRPGPASDYSRDLREVPGNAYSAVFETTMRPRDTLIKAAQAANSGEYGQAAMLGLRAPLSMVYPPAAAGTPGSSDDWRDDARRLGVGEANIMAIDLMTDPETYLATPLPVIAAGSVAWRAFRAAGKAGEYARYGRGVPTHLVDGAGEEIRRLLNSPSIGRRQMGY
jgi:hypothetical protein